MGGRSSSGSSALASGWRWLVARLATAVRAAGAAWAWLVAVLRAPAAGWGWLVAGLAATVLALGAGAAEKAPCLSHPWDGFQYTYRCYNDIIPLHGARHLDTHQVPYLSFEEPGEGQRLEDAKGFNEYPVLTGLLQYAASFAPGGGTGFFWANALVLSLCALAAAAVLWRGGVPAGWLLAFSLAPPLALYAFNNWDLLAVALATAGLVAHRLGRPVQAGLWLALGASAKVYPAILLVLVGCDLLRAERGLGRAGWRFGLAAVATLALLHGPFLLANAPGWLATYQFHLARGPTLETPWTVLAHAAGPAGDAFWTRQAPAVASLLLLAGFALLAAAVGLGRLRVQHAALAAVALFLALNKVHSVQYALWVVPTLALAPVRWWLAVPFLLGDLLVFWTLWPLFHAFEHSPGLVEGAWAALTVAVLLRWGGQLLLVGSAVATGWVRPQGRAQAGRLQQKQPLL